MNSGGGGGGVETERVIYFVSCLCTHCHFIILSFTGQFFHGFYTANALCEKTFGGENSTVF